MHILLLRIEKTGKQGEQDDEDTGIFEETKTAEKAGKKRGGQQDNPQGGNFDPNQNIKLKKK